MDVLCYRKKCQGPINRIVFDAARSMRCCIVAFCDDLWAGLRVDQPLLLVAADHAHNVLAMPALEVEAPLHQSALGHATHMTERSQWRKLNVDDHAIDGLRN